MLPSLGFAAALLFPGALAAVPRIFPRLPLSNGTTTANLITPTPDAGSPIETPSFTATPSLTSSSWSTSDSTPSFTDPVSGTIATPSLTFGSNGGITISGVVTIHSASLPASLQTTGTAALVGIGPAATSAGGSFLDVAAAAASSIAANPSPSAEDIEQFEQEAQDNFEQLSDLQAQLKEIDRDSLGDDKSHKVEASLAGLAALLAWYSTQISALAPALATPALASGIFAELAPAFAAAAAGDLLANALDGLEDFDQDDDDGDDDDDDDNDHSTTTDDSTTATSTETSTTPSATSSCSAIPYTLSLPDEDDVDDGDDMKRSLDANIDFGESHLVRRGGSRKRIPYFGQCNPATPPPFPGNPNQDNLIQAEKDPKSGANARYNQWKLDTADAQALGPMKRFNVDHVWELRFFTDYFESFLPSKRLTDPNAPSITCDDFNNIFLNPQCVLKSVVDSVPSANNPEFVAMRSNVNAAKGAMFKTGGLKGDRFTKDWRDSTILQIQVLQDLGIAVDIFKQPEVVNLFDITNQRMYNTLLGIDNRVRDTPIIIGNKDFSFAATYESFMKDRMIQATEEAWDFVQSWMSTIETDLASRDAEDVETVVLLANYDGFKNSAYALESHYSFSVNTDLASGANAVQFKRDLWARDGSCPLDQSTPTATGKTSITETSTSESTETTEQSTTLTSQISTPVDQTPSVASTLTTFSTTTLSTQSTSKEAPVTSVTTVSELPAPNPAGTNIHVGSGCILINGSPRCASDAGNISSVYESSYNVAADPNQPNSTALILAGFDASRDNYLHSTSTCQLQALFPYDYGDVYFNADGCLYDASNNKIFDQCCGSPDPSNSGLLTNPYVAPEPAAPAQSHGNHDGSSICRSFGKDTCLAAASRYVDDIVYHQYTSAVWPDSTGADIANEIFPVAGPLIEDLFGINYGCTVIWTCDDDAAFAQGMTGKQIKDSMLNVYNLNGAKGCGSTYLDNGCHITVNGCNNCRDVGRDATIWNPYDVYAGTYGDASDGFAPKR